MDNLKAIIHTLSNEDIKEFKVFINRQKRKKNRKDLDLFEILLEKEDYKPDQIIYKLYDTRNKEAYHALRKRLIRHLMDFIVVKRMSEDPSAASSIMGMLSLATYLFEKRANRLAWIYLKKAEELAIANEQYELLNSVYNKQIEEAFSDTAEELESIIAKKNEIKHFVDVDERAIMANSTIRKKLGEARISGEPIDFDKVIKETYERFELTNVIHRRPKLLYSILSMTRSVIIAKKDYYSFEPFIIEEYNRVVSERAFTKATHHYQLSFLYVIAHVLYRNKKFSRALEVLEELHNSMLDYGRINYYLFFTRYNLLLAAVNSYMGKNQEAIGILTNFIEKEKKHLNTDGYLIARLNLAVYHFQGDDFKQANKVLHSIHHTDKWLIKKLGIEWVLKKNMIELIVQYELGNDDIALNRIRSIERNFADLFKNTTYTRAKHFLGFVRKYMNDALIATDPNFIEMVRDELVTTEHEQEDIQAMTFFSWLKAKMERRPYYEVLIEMVNSAEN